MSISNLSKKFKGNGYEVNALRGINFDLYQGEMLAVMGTSGSGKSTLLNIIGALDVPDSGIITLNGEKQENMFTEPHATKFRSDNVGFIFQSFHLLRDLSVEENIALPLILAGVSQTEIDEKVRAMLDIINLTQWRKHRPIQLSGGQQQRVAIGRALIMSPPIILADEPTGNLDHNTSNEILNVMVEMKSKLKQSIILVTHDANIAAYADRILFFHDGNIVDSHVTTRRDIDIPIILKKFERIIEGIK